MCSVLRRSSPTAGYGVSVAGDGRPSAIKDAHVVYGGIDTDYYSPGGDKDEFFLWMNRWQPAKGYHAAIRLARQTGIPLVMAGDRPEDEIFDYQRQCALEAQRLAAGLPNVRFEWLPRFRIPRVPGRRTRHRGASPRLVTTRQLLG